MTEFVGGALGWSEPLYRAWYLTGAVWVAGGWAWDDVSPREDPVRLRRGISVVLAGLFTFLSWRGSTRQRRSPYLYLLIAVVADGAIGVETYRAKGGGRTGGSR